MWPCMSNKYSEMKTNYTNRIDLRVKDVFMPKSFMVKIIGVKLLVCKQSFLFPKRLLCTTHFIKTHRYITLTLSNTYAIVFTTNLEAPMCYTSIRTSVLIGRILGFGCYGLLAISGCLLPIMSTVREVNTLRLLRNGNELTVINEGFY